MRTKPTERRRGELLDAAEALVLDRGIDALTVDDVTAGAGVAKGTFYLYFANKNELVNALRDRYVERFVQRQRAASCAPDPADRVEQWVRAGILEYLDNVALHDILFRHTTRPEQATSNLAVDALRDLLVETAAPTSDPEATAVILYHAMHGTADHVLHEPDDRERILTELSRLCRVLLPSGSVC